MPPARSHQSRTSRFHVLCSSLRWLCLADVCRYLPMTSPRWRVGSPATYSRHHHHQAASMGPLTRRPASARSRWSCSSRMRRAWTIRPQSRVAVQASGRGSGSARAVTRSTAVAVTNSQALGGPTARRGVPRHHHRSPSSIVTLLPSLTTPLPGARPPGTPLRSVEARRTSRPPTCRPSTCFAGRSVRRQ